MFENIIGQPAASQIENDIKTGNLAQSMLFAGPPDSGKGSAALELARVLSCEKDTPHSAEKNCACPSCEQHRYLQSEDLLILGKRKFSAEIAAFASVCGNNPGADVKLLFYRALRKLQIRFSPYITEDDVKAKKLASQLESFDGKLSDLKEGFSEKLRASLVKDAQIIEEEGLSQNIPIGHIRRASYWCRLAPNGKRKVLIIESAENMKDEARNSLLKLLEEPPPSVSIILAAQRKESIIPTILSRLRPYRFLNRSAESENEVLRGIFHAANFDEKNAARGSLITAYLDSFMPASEEKMLPLAKWFIGQNENNAQTAKTLLAKSNNFENDSFTRFLKLCLELAAENARKQEGPEFIAYYDNYKKYINEAVAATEVLNQNVTIALEALLYKLKTKMEKIYA